ncbi:Ribosomal large subunit pseudouridine synthase f, partial [Globisporangium splendens]
MAMTMTLGRIRALLLPQQTQTTVVPSKRWLHRSIAALQQSHPPSSPPSSGSDGNDAENDGMIRLAKLMAQRGLCSRREADAYIQAGNVVVNGEKVQGDWLKVPIDSDVQLDFRAQRHQNKKVTIVLNKPLGVVSSQPEDNHMPAIKLLTFENECRELNKVRPRQQEEPINLWKMAVCGRLDVNSTGVLLFTQDGTIAKQILDPSGGIEKEYLVRVDVNLDAPTPEIEKKLKQLRKGVTSKEGITYRAKSVEVLNANQLRIVLTEGKNRHIRRMCEHVGMRVMALKRVRIGGIKLGKLPVGQWRYLQPTDRL